MSPTVTISKNGGSFASPSGTVSEVGNGVYKVAGNATDSNTLGPLWLHATATGADPCDDVFPVVGYDPQATNAKANVTQWNGTNVASPTNAGYPLVDLHVDLHHADINVERQITATTDSYTVVWMKNGVRVTSGITSPTIEVVKRSDGMDLVASTAMTQIGSTGAYKYDEAANRITAGVGYLVIASATIDGSTRTFSRLVGRDAS